MFGKSRFHLKEERYFRTLRGPRIKQKSNTKRKGEINQGKEDEEKKKIRKHEKKEEDTNEARICPREDAMPGGTEREMEDSFARALG